MSAASGRATVDVVVATHRVGPFLAEALESVVAQTYRNWRLILVDDGCEAPDELDRLAQGIPGTRVVHQRNAGVAAARNSGMRVGDGDVIAFLDDDDRWPPERLERLIGALEAEPDALGAFGGGVYIDHAGRRFGTWHTEAATSDEFLSGSTPIPRIVALVVRRAAVDTSGMFDESFRLTEDDEFILRLLRHGSLVSSSDSPVVEYRRHTRNLTIVGWRAHYQGGLRAILANLDGARANGDTAHERLLRANLRRYMSATAAGSTSRAIGHLRRGRVRDAGRDVRDSFRISPLGFVRGTVWTVAGRAVRRLGSRRAWGQSPSTR